MQESIKEILMRRDGMSKFEADDLIKDAQTAMFKHGITTINEAGLERETIELIDNLQQKGELDINIYAMVMASKVNINYYTQLGIYKTDKLNVRYFKFMGVGALGSRGGSLH